MGLKRVTGNNKNTQKLINVDVVSAIKGSNQTNPRSGGTTLVEQLQIKLMIYKGGHSKLHDSNQICQTLEAGTSKGGGTSNRPLIAFGQTTLTNTPVQSTENDLGKSKRETYEQLMLTPYQNTTSSVRDFLANLSQSLGGEVDSKILEAHYSLRYAESYGLKELSMYSLRMSRDSFRTMTDIPSKPLSERWMNWGMTANGKCLTARISESHKTGKGCSLSDILEDNPSQKYFLSDKTLSAMINHKARHQEVGNGFGMNILNGNDARALRVGGSNVTDNLITSTLSERYFKDGAEILIQEDNYGN